ncbi:hypothetical protein MTO96_050017 [Rhipicephalus appendiculatus]
MDDQRQAFRYRVCGFGNHVEQKTVEFTEKLDDLHTCSWCGVVSAYSSYLSCSHMVCEECLDDANKAAITVCWIDKQNIGTGRTACNNLRCVYEKKIVRCTNVDRGCDYTGRLAELDRHLSESCAWYLKGCSKCGEDVAYKDFFNHFKTCKGVVGVLLRAADGQSLLEDIRNASKELEQASTSTSSDVRDALSIFTEQLESLRRQLAANSEGRADNVKLEDCNQ